MMMQTFDLQWFNLNESSESVLSGELSQNNSFIDLQWFAAEDEGRTEEPSQEKLRKAREEGRVAKSQDLTSSVVFLFSLITMIFMSRQILRGCAEVYRFFFDRINDPVNSPSFVYIFFRSLVTLVLPITIVGVLAGVITNIAQNKGFIFAPKAISPKFSNIIPKFGQYFKKTIFSLKGVFNIIKSIGKVAIIVIISYFLIRKNIDDILMTLQNGNIFGCLVKVSAVAAKLLVIAAVLFLVISIPDYVVNKQEFMESMKMSKYEQKQEYKEMEGDPEIKSRLMQAQKQLLQQNMPKAVAEADVLITNPTHFSVAVKYDKSVNDSPLVTAKGEDYVALQMRRIADENGVPRIENRPLARGLYTDTEVGDIIPEEYIPILVNIYVEISKYDSKKIKK